MPWKRPRYRLRQLPWLCTVNGDATIDVLIAIAQAKDQERHEAEECPRRSWILVGAGMVDDLGFGLLRAIFHCVHASVYV